MAGEEETFWLNWSGMVNLVQNIVKNFESIKLIVIALF